MLTSILFIEFKKQLIFANLKVYSFFLNCHCIALASVSHVGMVTWCFVFLLQHVPFYASGAVDLLVEQNCGLVGF